MILIIIDQLIKKRYYILYTIDKNNIIAKIITYLLSNNVKKIYSLFLPLTLNQDFQFILRV